MQNTNTITEDTTSTPSSELGSETEIKKKSNLFFIVTFVLGIFLIIVFIVLFVVSNNNKQSDIDLIDQSQTTITNSLKDTDNIDQGLADLSDQFLDSETVTQDNVDSVLDDIEVQLQQLNGLENDLSFTDSDVGF